MSTVVQELAVALRILLVEDNPGDALLTREQLDDSGLEYALELRGTLEEGLSALRSESFDVLALDLGLPDGVGLEALRRVHAEAADLPIVVLSANEPEGLRCIQEGAQDFVPKGELSPGVLTRALVFAIERRRLGRLLERNQEEVRARLARAGLVLDLLVKGLRERAREPEVMPLSKCSPSVFEALTGSYVDLLRTALAKLPDDLGRVEACSALADHLAYLAATPEDLIELHRGAVQKTLSELSPEEQPRLSVVASELMIQMLSHLAGAYRHLALAAGVRG